MKVRVREDSEVLSVYPWLKNKEWWAAEWDACGTSVTLEDPELPTVHGNNKLHISFEAIKATKHASGLIQQYQNQVEDIPGTYEYGTIAIPKEQYATVLGGEVGSGLSMCANTDAVSLTVQNSTLTPMAGFTITSSTIGSWNAQATYQSEDRSQDEPEVELHMADLTMEDLIAEETAATTVIRRIKVVPDSPYWLALKGVAQVLGGLHLRFYKELWSNLNCEEYRYSECLILASTKEIECSDVFQGQYVQSLQGLIIPSEFLE